MNKSIKLILVLALSPPLGYLLHEGGHYVFGVLNGYELEFHHNRVIPVNHNIYTLLENSTIAPNYSELNKTLKINNLLFFLGGPIITITLSIIGFLLVKSKANIILGYFLGVNILREIYISLNNILFKNSFNDEKQIAYLLNINLSLFSCIVLIFSTYLFWCIIKNLDNKDKSTMIISTFIGLPIGLFLWLFLGEFII